MLVVHLLPVSHLVTFTFNEVMLEEAGGVIYLIPKDISLSLHQGTVLDLLIRLVAEMKWIEKCGLTLS